MNRRAVALSVAAHPDDIEFGMAGTMLLLKAAGWRLHYMTLADGSCGSMEHGPAKIRRIRRRESERAAAILGAAYHPSLVPDLEILYELPLIRRLAATIREVNPSILLIPSPQDYMEDHVNTCRIAVTAAFSRGMPNFKTIPTRKSVAGEVTLYHAMPHGLKDALNEPIRPGFFIDTTSVHEIKRRALAAHESQQGWLDTSQGLDSYLSAMDEMSETVGKMSRRFRHAEGWRRHSHIGFCGPEADPLRDALGVAYLANRSPGKGRK